MKALIYFDFEDGTCSLVESIDNSIEQVKLKSFSISSAYHEIPTLDLELYLFPYKEKSK